MRFHVPLRVALTMAIAATPALFAAEAPAEKKAAAAAPAADKDAAKTPAIPDVVAVVEGVEIKKAELEKAFGAILAAQGVPAAAVQESQKLQSYHMILDELILEKLIQKRSKDIPVTDDEVKAALAKIQSNFGSEEDLKKQVEKSGQTMEKVRADIRSSLQAQKWLEDQVKNSAKVSEADAEKFYKSNTEQFQQPEQVRASHILIRVPDDAKPEQVVEKEKQAQSAADRAKKGEDFSKLATELSEDPSAKQNAGDLDFFAKEQMVPEFSDAAFGMKKGDISNPVRSQFGYHVIKLTDRKAAETVKFDEAKPQIIAFLEQQGKQEELQKIVGEIREKADIKIHLPQPPEAAEEPEVAPAEAAAAPAAEPAAAPKKK